MAETVFSGLSGRTCGALLCCGTNAFIVPRSPVTCVTSQVRFELRDPTGSVARILSDIGFAEATIDECDCQALYESLADSGISDIGEWGHELWLYRDCDPNEPLFVGPITGQLSTTQGDLTLFASDRLAWLARTQMVEDIIGTFTIGELVTMLIGQADEKNCTGIALDPSIRGCVEPVTVSFSVSDGLTPFDYLLELSELGFLSFSYVGARLYVGCPQMELSTLRVNRGHWATPNVPVFRNGFELATRFCGQSDIPVGDEVESVTVCDPPAGEDAADPFYGCHERLETGLLVQDVASLEQVARRGRLARRRTPRLFDGNAGFNQTAPFCHDELVPGRPALVEGGTHSVGAVVEQTLGSVEFAFENGQETGVIPSFLGAIER